MSLFRNIHRAMTGCQRSTTSFDEMQFLLDAVLHSMYLWHPSHFTWFKDKCAHKWLSFAENVMFGPLPEKGWKCIITIFSIILAAPLIVCKDAPRCSINWEFGAWPRILRMIRMKLTESIDMDPNRNIAELTQLYISLHSTRSTKSHRSMVLQMLQEIKEMQWRRVKCQNAFCAVSREDLEADSKRMYKCKTCRCARYCSRRCQKVDWLIHKPLCAKLNYMYKDRKRVCLDFHCYK